ncbi:MAG: tetratricopeptide repeat protein [Myxococcales bacterium]|nr:MAG: tetratricopeptide repeat protein [Myxococcales bacterium]
MIPRLVKVCIAGSHYNAALQHATPYLNAHPKEWKLRQLVALILIATGEHEKAKQELDHVLRDAPNAAFCHFILASLLRDHFQSDSEAISHFTAYLELEPSGNHAEEAQNSITLLTLALQNDTSAEDRG